MNAEPDRDRMLDQALKQALGTGDHAPATAACLDAETLAAWMDGGLDAVSLAMAESHVSGCSRCQALVGTVARATPAVNAGAEGRASLWRWWFAPLAAGAAAVTLWMVVPQPQPSAPALAPLTDVAQAPPADVARAPLGASEARQPQTVPPAVEETRRETVPPAGLPAAARDAGKRSAEASAETDTAQNTNRVAGATGLEKAERRADAPPAAQYRSQASAIEILSPDPSRRWRVGEGGIVDYSADGGRTWDRLSALAGAAITTGSSPTPDVCWLVGRGGVVFVTTDGRAFAPAALPEAADLVGVQSTSALTAIVTAADGRTFFTDDGGRTWRRQ